MTQSAFRKMPKEEGKVDKSRLYPMLTNQHIRNRLEFYFSKVDADSGTFVSSFDTIHTTVIANNFMSHWKEIYIRWLLRMIWSIWASKSKRFIKKITFKPFVPYGVVRSFLVLTLHYHQIPSSIILFLILSSRFLCIVSVLYTLFREYFRFFVAPYGTVRKKNEYQNIIIFTFFRNFFTKIPKLYSFFSLIFNGAKYLNYGMRYFHRNTTFWFLFFFNIIILFILPYAVVRNRKS